MNKGRFEAYTDAIIAIVVTLLVLEIPRPEGFTFAALLHDWRTYIVYLITFLQIMAIWYNHHNLLKYIKMLNHHAYWANAVWLLFLSTSPFAMAWVMAYPTHWQPIVFFAVLWLLWSVTYSWLEAVLLRANPSVSAKQPAKNLINLIMLALTILVAFVAPLWGIAVIGLLTLWLIVSPFEYSIKEEDK
ncbi:TMEM175 family protein [Lacticaseibacillus brantae]|uniref:Integral membrane protein n=1 Tax=Lacticaseibacillus brantae DSM 23927 TaxID=1423727 RepID=A0A0R2AWY0_9LACO|nr:TMEM175 family protein [Lacticaseibacillus brantae]KRM71194.1 hypothetical protein FC34_GL001885 [Lacticaseibacillus brantae DSM 23927]